MTPPISVLDAILIAIQSAADHNQDETVRPACILWTDEKREWERLVPRFRLTLPQFIIFGPFDAANRTGPAIWLRCVIAGKVPEITWPATAVPILYLPGVSRATLRATEDCPDELKPLAELQYRGVFWSQVNGKTGRSPRSCRQIMGDCSSSWREMRPLQPRSAAASTSSLMSPSRS
jgi:hypothetical protein